MNWLKELESSTLFIVTEDFKLDELHSNNSAKVESLHSRRYRV